MAWIADGNGIKISSDTLSGDAAQAINGNFTTISALISAFKAPSIGSLAAAGSAGQVARYGNALYVHNGTGWRRVGAVFTGNSF